MSTFEAEIDHRSLEEDAEPIPGPPLPLEEEVKEELLDEKWDFKINLLKVLDKITTADLKRMKWLLKGSQGVGKHVLQKVNAGIDLIDLLEEMGKFDEHNLIHLQALVWHTQNDDLQEAFISFARSCSARPLHFFEDEENEDHSGEKVHFHLSGTAIDREKIEILRGVVAKYMCVPLENVQLNGVKPFRSIIVTFLVPKRVTKFLLDLPTHQKRVLQSMDIDNIQVGEENVSLKGKTFDGIPVLSESDEIKRMMKAKSKLENDLEKANEQLLEKEQQLRNLRSKYEREKETLQRTQKYSNDLLNTVRSLQGEQSSEGSEGIQSSFSDLWKEFENKHSDAISIVKRLMDLNSEKIRQAETSLWIQLSDVLHTYLDYMMKTYKLPTTSVGGLAEIGTKEDQRDETNMFDQGLHELSNELDSAQRETLKLDTLFTEDEQDCLERDPHKYLHILSQHKDRTIKDPKTRYKFVMSLIQRLQNQELDRKAKLFFDNAVSHSETRAYKHATRFTVDPHYKAHYVRSVSMDPSYCLESAKDLYLQMENIKIKLHARMEIPMT